MNTNITQSSKKGLWFFTVQFIRILVGVLFIFSGLVKANDPMGLAYKMEEFFELWHLTFMSPYALFFSITIIVFEIIAGVALLLGYAFCLFSILLLLLMIFFTFLTAYAVWYQWANQRELACGCFGDCIPLTANQSFMKDIILVILVVILLFAKDKIKPLFKRYIGTSLMILSFSFSLFIQWYALEHLPFVDCLAYKKGNNLWEKMQVPENAVPDQYQTTYYYKNIVSGEKKSMPDTEFLTSKIWEDTTWVEDKEPETILIKKGNAIPEIADFNLYDFQGNNYTEFIIRDTGYTFIWFVKDVNSANQKHIDRIKNLVALSEANGVKFYVAVSNNQEDTDKLLMKHNLSLYTFTIDATVCKTLMRTNPGLMLLHKSVVQGKWSYNDYPESFEMDTNQKMIIK